MPHLPANPSISPMKFWTARKRVRPRRSRYGPTASRQFFGGLLVDQPHQRLDRPIQRLIRLRLVRLRVEVALVRIELRPEIRQPPFVGLVELVQVPVVLLAVGLVAEHARDQVLVDRLDHGIHADVIAVDVDQRVRLARRRDRRGARRTTSTRSRARRTDPARGCRAPALSARDRFAPTRSG